MKQLLKGLGKKMRGDHAENLALTHLQKHALKLQEKNYRCRYGEIDLVMLDGNTLVFVEVRMRSSNQFGGALASVDHKKQQKLIKTGQHYLQTKSKNAFCRFDVIGINGQGEINWIKNAFQT